MKNYILVVSFLSVSLAVSAQTDSLKRKEHRFTFGVDGGTAMSDGNFASGSFGQKNPQSSLPAYLTANAMPGFHYDVYGGFRFYKSIGIMIEYGANTNPYSQSGSNNSPNDFTPSENGTFNSKEYLVGPYFTAAITKIRIEAKLLFGNLTSNYPTLTSNNPNYPVSETFQNGRGTLFCFGTKIKYMMLKNKIGIGVGISYINSDVTYPDWTIAYAGFSQIQTQGSIKMSIGITQITLGVSWDM